ncbi:hypothetical protein TRAPUB_8997 [Trametes pubescens]|uniref:Uncharacterized protein n=1 Tax=Trametes pubescens TaxID=154538 RepID=A0A1M2W3J9_TRAPU|nr:hypothetical protein TRAPUB_8997 [Trametes pubescens]
MSSTGSVASAGTGGAMVKNASMFCGGCGFVGAKSEVAGRAARGSRGTEDVLKLWGISTAGVLWFIYASDPSVRSAIGVIR